MEVFGGIIFLLAAVLALVFFDEFAFEGSRKFADFKPVNIGRVMAVYAISITVNIAGLAIWIRYMFFRESVIAGIIMVAVIVIGYIPALIGAIWCVMPTRGYNVWKKHRDEK